MTMKLSMYWECYHCYLHNEIMAIPYSGEGARITLPPYIWKTRPEEECCKRCNWSLAVANLVAEVKEDEE